MRAIGVLLVATGLAIAGCGGDDAKSGDEAQPTPTPATAGVGSGATDAANGKVQVGATDFRFAPQSISANPGKLEVTLKNNGQAPHEFVLIETDSAPGDLPKDDQGRASEDGAVGEVEEIPAGATGKHLFEDLQPGKYVYVCNVPTHYAAGMFGQLTVK